MEQRNRRMLDLMEYTNTPIRVTTSGRNGGDIWPVEGGYRNSRTSKVHRDKASAIQDLFPATWITNLPEH